MKKYLFILFAAIGLTSCSEKAKVNSEIEEIPVEVQVLRFDKEFVETPDAEFSKLKQKYPFLLPVNVPDEEWMNKRNDSLFKVLYKEVQTQFADTKQLETDLESLFKHIKYYFPNQKPGKVVTLISEVDVDAKTIYTDSLSIISLDTYLGKDHRFYEVFDTYLLGGFEPTQITSDLAESFITTQLSYPNDRQFLSQIIYSGKIMYAKDLLIPNASDDVKMGYSPEQIQWCFDNESHMWKYFIENKLLYDSDSKLYGRFIQNAPFSKFYLDLDAESPGRVGVWIGWQIVRSYMKNNNVTLQELFAKDAKEIFDNSKYKPKK
ncbi:gliding motility lipoprotein GldB [Paenimyroides tangerinum]|uniref:Gliding motility lipoprotein GldB n=1 Tax=Paenimyroides tangerinum TaxID=2488728 RepID=A0A3P3WH06_9FLAO|nr:gliding motility lipoprotein GldB [Paenimyroides tangerinum]RRJ91903.1 gliding motility lipoprotein GldB [Paenimyroides tangerinum]